MWSYNPNRLFDLIPDVDPRGRPEGDGFDEEYYDDEDETLILKNPPVD